MYSVEIPKIPNGCVAVVLHHPESVGHFGQFAEAAVVSKRGEWLDRAAEKFGANVRLYEDGTAFLGLGSYGRPRHGSWETFTAKQLSDPLECVRTAA